MADAAQLRYPSLPENKSRMVRIAEYSRDCIKALREQTGIGYEGRQGGTLQLFRTAQQYESASKDIAVLKEAGVPYELLEAQQLSRVEPALAATCHKLTGGLRLPNDETGDCQLFTQRLAEMAAQAGVTFRFNTAVDRLLREGNRIAGVKCGNEVLTADSYVVAFGSRSTALLKDIVSIPVYPLKGYSLTIPLRDEAGAPVSTVLDETYKVAITRFDQRIRVGAWRKSSASIPGCCRRGAKRWRWWCAISIPTAAISSRPASGPACAR